LLNDVYAICGKAHCLCATKPQEELQLRLTRKNTTLAMAENEKPHSILLFTGDWSMNRFAKALRVFAGRYAQAQCQIKNNYSYFLW
jgi:type IV pilus biogenesis protein CpaD/CtpE